MLLEAEEAKVDLLRAFRQEVPKEMLLHLLLPLLAHPTWAMALRILHPRLHNFPNQRYSVRAGGEHAAGSHKSCRDPRQCCLTPSLKRLCGYASENLTCHIA